MKHITITVLCLILFSTHCFSQEFRGRVTVNSQKIQSVDKSVFSTLEQGLTAFVNERKWSNFNLKNEEKIECNIQLVIETAPSEGDFTGKLLVQVSRPVFNSSYMSPLFTSQDNDIAFTYSLNQSMDYDFNSYQTELTAFMGFYLNFFLGVFFDSFALQGGSSFFDQCQNIVNYSKDKSKGWSGIDSRNSRNRHWLAENMTNPSYTAIHTFLYKYHRLGLDVMSQDVEKGTTVILEALEELQQLNKTRSGIYMISLIFTAKSDEFVNVFSGASQEKRTKAAQLLRAMDPLNDSKYAKLVE